MKRIFAILLTLVLILGTWTTAIALPEGAVARLGKGSISSADRAVQFSPDGTLLAVATSIGVYLYDAQTYDEVALLETSAGMSSISFSPDGRILASGSWDRTIKLWDVAQRKLITTLTGHTSFVHSVAFSPDGRIVASGSDDYTIKLWDVSQRKLLDTLTGHTGWVYSVAFSPDGRILASGSRDKTINLWDVSQRKLLDTLIGHTDRVHSVAFSPDGRMLASGSDDDTIKLWDIEQRQLIGTLAGRSVAFSPDGRIVASGSWDGTGTIKLWDVAQRKLIDTLTGHTGSVYSVAFSPDGRILAGGSYQEIKLWDVAGRKLIDTLTGHTDVVRSVAFSPDGRIVASGSDDKTIKLWDVSQRKLIDTLTGHTSGVSSVAFSPDGGILASGGSWDRTIKLWDVSQRKLIDTLTGHTDDVSSVSFNPDGRMLASGSWDRTIKLWDVSQRKLIDTLTGHTSGVSSVAFSPDGSLLASGSWDGTIKLWDVSQRKLIDTLTGPSSVNSVAFSPDGRILTRRILASGSDDDTIKLWDVSQRKPIATLTGHTSGVNSVAFSPDGSLLASGSGDDTIKLWDVSQRKLIDILTGHTDSVTSVAFSPDDSLLASGSGDNTIKLWDAEKRELIATSALTGHTSYVTSVAFSPDGRLLASGGGWFDSTIKLWDVEQRKLITTLTGHSLCVDSVVFSPGGRILASVGWDGTILLWDMEPYIGFQRYFNPQSDGYGFRNFSDPSLFVWDVFRDTFGKEQVEYGDTGIHKPIADIFFVEHYLPFIGHQVLGGGVCNGMAATSLLFFENPSTLANFSATAQNTNQLEPTHELKYHIEVYQGYQLGLLIKDWKANQNKDPAALFNIIKNSLKKSPGDQQVINIYGKYNGKMAGHSVAPWKIEEKGNNVYWVYVYDCNYPFASAETDALQRKIVFNLDKHNWEYEFTSGAIWTGDDKNQWMNLVPLAFYHEAPILIVGLFGGITTADYGAAQSIEGAAHLLFEDDEGRRLGYVNGELVSEISGAIPIIPLAGAADVPYPETYYISKKAKLQPKILETGEGSYDFSIYTTNTMFKLDDVTTTGDGADMLEVGDDENSIKFSTTAESKRYTAILIREQKDVARSYAISDTTISKDGEVVFQVSEDLSSFSLVNKGSEKTFDLNIEQSGTEARAFVAKGLSISANETRKVEVQNWGKLEQVPLIISIDKGNDGTIDDVQTVKSLPTWDVNCDGRVDIFDLALVVTHFGERIIYTKIENPDVNRDGVVDIADLALVGRHLGK